MKYAKHLLSLSGMVVLNRARGDVWFHDIGLPGRSLFYATALVALLAAWILNSYKKGAAFAAAFFAWGIAAWGRWFGLGRLPENFHRENIAPSIYESAIWTLAHHNFHVALFLRHLNILPGLLLLGWVCNKPNLWLLAPVMAIAFVGSYEIAWDVGSAQSMIVIAELIAGLVWGFLLLGLYKTNEK